MVQNINSGNVSQMANLLNPSESQASAGAAKGSYNGQSVSVQKDAMSLLADSAEEMTFAVAEKTEKKATERKKTENKKKTGSTEAAIMMAQKLKDINPEQLQKFLSQAKAAGADAGKLKQLARQFSKDSTKQHLALSYVLEELENDPEMKEALQSVIGELEAKHGEEIQAGYNIDGVDADGVGGAEEGRSLYRGTVLGFKDVVQAFTHLVDKYGEEGLTDSLQFLRQAIGADLSATNPSTTKAELKTVNDDLYQVQVLSNIKEDFNNMLEKLGKDYGYKKPAKSAIKVMMSLLKLKDERLVDASRVKSCLPMKGSTSPTHDVHLVTTTKSLVHKFPMKIYKDEGTRQNLLDGVQALLDQAIDLEEEMLDEEME
jgi:type III secretion protein W